MHYGVLGLVLMVTASLCRAAAPETDTLGRVFFTAKERLVMDAERKLALSGSVASSRSPLQQVDRIALDAVLIGVRKAVWINRQLVEEVVELAGVRIDPRQATADGLWLITPQGRKLLKQGQVYVPASGKVVERYEIM